MKHETRLAAFLIAITSCFMPSGLHAQDLGTEGYVDSDGVKLHYVTAGEGPLVVMIHGFPDYWYTWRNQMPELAKHFQVVAYDQRGYNKSDKPDGVDNYKVEKLVADLVAVVDHFKQEKAIIVGHDWGGMVAWTFAMTHPDRIDRLVILNLLTPEVLAFWVKGDDARQRYIEAFRRSSIEGMLNYYKANYPREPYDAAVREFPNVQCSVLMFHGLSDLALLPGALNDTWQWIDRDLSLITIPDAGHFVQHDAADFVTQKMVNWLTE